VARPSLSPSRHLRRVLSELCLMSRGVLNELHLVSRGGPHPNETGAQLHEAGPQSTLSHPAKLYKS
jgi:hypothetical protein